MDLDLDLDDLTDLRLLSLFCRDSRDLELFDLDLLSFSRRCSRDLDLRDFGSLTLVSLFR
mgnify:CR=1 FL=1